MKIGELAQRSGLSVHTIRYYEKIGLLPLVGRDGARHRDYPPSILGWIEFLGRLKTTGMPLRDMIRYARWREQGPDTGALRRGLLEQHRQQVASHLEQLQECLRVLDAKIAFYTDRPMN